MTTPRITRRQLFRAGAGAAAALAAAPGRAAVSGGDAGRTLVCVRLRGGADAFSLLVPYREPGYYRARPNIAIEPPGRGPNAALKLDDRFALHPCLAGWQRLFQGGELGAVVGVGLRARYASHRQAQHALDAALIQAGGNPTSEVLAGDLAEQLQRVAASLDPGAPRTVLVESLGWDTHVAQGRGSAGRLAVLAKELALAVVAFRAAADRHMSHVRMAIVTEFGRTLSESPTCGTDDAYASALFTLASEGGGAVLGTYGRVEPGSPCSERLRPPTVDLESLLTRFVRDEVLL